MPSWAAVVAEIISCRTPRDCELRLPRGSHMVLEVAAEVPSIAEYVSGITGTITELSPQSLTALKLSPWMSQSSTPVDRLYLKWEVQHTPRL